MPKARKNQRKFNTGDKVWFTTEAISPTGEVVLVRQYGIITAYIQRGTKKRGKYVYAVLRTYDSGNNYVYGGAVYVPSWKLFKDEESYHARNRKAPARWRANQRIGTIHERGCVCNCCVHVPYQPSDVLKDGTFKWEEE